LEKLTKKKKKKKKKRLQKKGVAQKKKRIGANVSSFPGELKQEKTRLNDE